MWKKDLSSLWWHWLKPLWQPAVAWTMPYTVSTIFHEHDWSPRAAYFPSATFQAEPQGSVTRGKPMWPPTLDFLEAQRRCGCHLVKERLDNSKEENSTRWGRRIHYPSAKMKLHREVSPKKEDGKRLRQGNWKHLGVPHGSKQFGRRGLCHTACIFLWQKSPVGVDQNLFPLSVPHWKETENSAKGK